MIDARSADPRRGPVALSALLSLTSPQVSRILTLWVAGLPAGAAGDIELLRTEVQLHIAACLNSCPVGSESAVHAWISARTLAWLVGHTRHVRTAAQRAAQVRVPA